jgi:tRNA(His) 5'-end guanylyltransferase
MRLDGRAFHTFTRGMERPLDERMVHCMVETAKYLCKEVSGCKIAYTQSDEISLLLVDYQNLQTQGWFDNEVQKTCSIAASMASVKFYEEYVKRFGYPKSLPSFDCRVWNVPQSEVCNYFIWRQQDATRNSIAMLAQKYFSHKQLHKVNSNMMQNMLLARENVNWNDCPTAQKRGIAIVKYKYYNGSAERSEWREDLDMPILTQDRNYINTLVYLMEPTVEGKR